MLLYYILNSIASVVILLIYAILYRKRFNLSFTIAEILAPMVCIAALFRARAHSVDDAFILNNIIYLAACYIVPLIFCGVVSLCDIKIKKIWIVLMFVSETLIYLSILTTRLTGWFYTSLSLGEDRGVTILIKEYGPMHKVAYAFLIFYCVSIAAVLVYALLKKRKAVKMHLIIISVVAILCICLFLFSRRFIGSSQEDVLSYAIFQAVVLYISYDSSYYYVDTYMIDKLGEGKGIGCITFNEKKRLLVCNDQAELWFPELKKLSVGSLVDNGEGINPRFSEWFEKVESTDEKRYDEIVKCKEMSIKLTITKSNIDGKNCYIFLLTDDTTQQEVLRVLNNNFQKVEGTVKQYIDPLLLETMLNEQMQYKDAGEEFTIACMFADLRGFTALTEELEPQKTIEILNKYLTIAENAIHKNGGIVDKYIGDAVMAFWIDLAGTGKAAYNAAKTAIEIKDTLVSIEDEVYKDLSKEIFYGIGLNYGKAILGNIGSENLKDFTVIGDTVNVASRLENNAPKNTIYATEEFKNVLGDTGIFEKSENQIRIKGKAAPLEIYELLGLGERKEDKKFVQVSSSSSKAFIYICGCRGSYPVSGVRFSKYGGETTSFIIKYNKHALVVDCGTGFLNAQSILKDCTTIDVVLTHLHYDHCIGILNWDVFPEGITPTFYGNFNAWKGKDTLHELFRPPFWPIDLSKGELVNAPKDDSPIVLSDNLEVRFFNAPHQNDAKLVVVDILGKRICIMADCENADGIPSKYLKNSDYLIYDGMYNDQEYVSHIGWGHSTWEEGCRIANKNNVGTLIITHHDAKNSDAILNDREEKAQLAFPATIFAKTGDRYQI